MQVHRMDELEFYKSFNLSSYHTYIIIVGCIQTACVILCTKCENTEIEG